MITWLGCAALPSLSLKLVDLSPCYDESADKAVTIGRYTNKQSTVRKNSYTKRDQMGH